MRKLYLCETILTLILMLLYWFPVDRSSSFGIYFICKMWTWKKGWHWKASWKSTQGVLLRPTIKYHVSQWIFEKSFSETIGTFLFVNFVKINLLLAGARTIKLCHEKKIESVYNVKRISCQQLNLQQFQLSASWNARIISILALYEE